MMTMLNDGGGGGGGSAIVDSNKQESVEILYHTHKHNHKHIVQHTNTDVKFTTTKYLYQIFACR